MSLPKLRQAGNSGTVLCVVRNKVSASVTNPSRAEKLSVSSTTDWIVMSEGRDHLDRSPINCFARCVER